MTNNTAKGIVLVDRLGDINFGLPEDIAPHKKPWAYYEILGIKRNASREDIRAAQRALSLKNHPDRFAKDGPLAQKEAEKRQRLINEIGDILLDDGQELGTEWSKRTLYNTVSRYGEFFGADHIVYHGERTRAIVEDLLNVLGLEKRGVEARHRFETQNPEVVRAINNLKRAVERGHKDAARRHYTTFIEKMAEKEGLSPEEFEKKQAEAIGEYKKEKEEMERKNIEFAYDLLAELRKEGSASDSLNKRKPRGVANKLFDIWYNGEENSFSTVIFAAAGWSHWSVVGYEESQKMITLGLKDSAVLTGMRKVHFKAQYADVTIKDAHLEGIFQIVKGRVTIEYEGSSYGTVMRVRAPTVHASEDFVRSGDLYVPKAFASKGWEKTDSKVDIAVFDGIVDLRLEKPAVQERPTYDNLCLDTIISTLPGQYNKKNIINPNKSNYNFY